MQELIAAVDQGDLRSETCHRLGQFAADRAAADHQEPAGAFLALEERLVGEKSGLPQTGDIRHVGAATGRDDDVPSAQHHVADAHVVRRFESRLAEKDVDSQPLEALHGIVRREVGPQRLDATDHAAVIDHWRHPIEGEIVGTTHQGGDPGRTDERLARHAAVVQTVSSHLVTLDQRHASSETGGAGGGHQTRRAGADHHDVVDPLAPVHAAPRPGG